MSSMRSKVQGDLRKSRTLRRRNRGSRPERRRLAAALQVLEPRHLLAFSTPLFSDINQLGVSALPDSFVELNNEVYFVANDGRTGSELWKSDGTEGGTVQVADLNPGPEGALPSDLTVFGNDLFFTALDADDEFDLWKTDGTTSGTVRVFDADAAGVYEISELTTSGNRLFFTAYQSASGYELWATDGTSSGTSLVRDINLDQTIPEPPRNLTDVNGKLFFTSYTNGYDNRELFESDGTSLGTLLVADIDGDPLESSNPDGLINVSGTLYFSADHPTTGVELYKSTGAAGATTRIGDINPGNSSSYPEDLTLFNGQVFFTANDGLTGRQLYKSDGTSVTLVANTTPDGNGSSSPADLTVVGSEMFFVSNGGKVPGPVAAHGPNFSTDNSFRSNSSNFAGLVDIRNSPYDGIVAGGNTGGSFSLPAQGGTVSDGPGWVGENARIGDVGVGLSGVEVGDFIIRDMDALNSSDVDLNATWDWTISDPAGLDGIDFSGFVSGNSFVTSDEAILFELFINGSATRSSFLEVSGQDLDNWYADRDANNLALSHPGGPTITSAMVRMTFKPDGGAIKTPNDSNEAIVIRASLTAVGQSSGVAGRELHKTDGTVATLVKDIVVPGSSDPSELTEVDGKLFFTANDPLLSGRELWTSDGSASGTTLVQDIRSGFDLYGAPLSGNPRDLTDVNGTLFFSVVDDQDDRETWTSDGTMAGTDLLKNINVGTRDADVKQVVQVGSKLFFVANDGINGEAVWVSDLNLGTTALAADVTASSSDRIHGLAKFGNGVIFYNNSLGVYTTDGTTTTAITSNTPVTLNTDGQLFVEAGSLAYFVFNDGVNGEELWKTDGTAVGTSMVSDVHDGATGSEPRDLIEFQGLLYFSANFRSQFGDQTGRELLRTDGTLAGTVLVADINIDPDPNDPFAPITLSSDPEELTVSDGKLYFTAESGTTSGNTGRELYVADGTINGVTLVSNIRSGSSDSDPTNLTDVNGVLYFSANNGSDGFEPYRSEGTGATTSQVANINGGSSSSNPDDFLQVGTLVYFSAFEANTGRELYQTDGTPGGTTIVEDLQVGTDSSSPTPLAALGGDRLLLAASAHGTVDRELWVAGGGVSGLTLGIDMNPGEFFGSDPQNVVPMGTGYVFIGNDGLSGRELYELSEAAVTVEGVVIDDGSEQRSSIGQFTVTFSAQVEITGDPFDFVNTTTGKNVVDVPIVTIEGGKTVVTFTFAQGDSVNAAGLLQNGNYRLTIDASLVTSLGLLLDGDGDGTAGDDYVFGAEAVDNFYRKFGDGNGNGTVDLPDFAGFRGTFGAIPTDSNWDHAFDEDGDGTVGLLDFAQFRQNFGT